jgi:methionine sulfoxide reductase heme-binding subunit
MAGASGRMTGVSSSQAVWFLTRGTGVVSLVLLTAVTVLGILNVVRWSPALTPRFVVQRVHRNLSLVSLVFIVIHIATAVIDGFAPIRWIDAVVPFRAAYRPLWLGLGAVAFDLLIAIAVTSLIRARLGYRVWRAVHWTSYALWGVAVFHGLGIGSDSKQLWMLALVVASVGAVVAAAVWRVAVGWPGWTPARLSMAVGAVSMPVVLGAWFVGGPLQPGWAARAGTPRQLLAHTSSAPSPSPSSTVATVRAPIVLPSQATGSGTTLLHQLAGDRARVIVSLQTLGSPALTFRVVLNGRQIPQGISMSDGSVVLTPSGGAAAYRGAVTGLSGGNISAELSDGHGDRIALTLALEISPGGQTSAQVLIQGLATGSAQV